MVTSTHIVSEISPSKAFSLLVIKSSLIKTVAGIDNLGFQIERLGKKNLILSHL